MCNASRQTLKLLMKLWISFNLIIKYQNRIIDGKETYLLDTILRCAILGFIVKATSAS